MKAAKRSILICVLTLILSVSLLAGVTFAWFTDSITNSGNTIQSGELAIDATAYDRVDTEAGGLTVTIDGENVASGTYYFEAEGTSLRNGDPVITEENWQPGDMNAKLFTVSNEGSIDAVVSFEFENETRYGRNDIEEALWFVFLPVNSDNSVNGAVIQRPMSEIGDVAEDGYALAPESSISFVLLYGMDENAGNEFQDGEFEASLTINATQENEVAVGGTTVGTADELVAAVAEGGNITLSADISADLAGKFTENTKINLNGYTLTNAGEADKSIAPADGKTLIIENGNVVSQLSGESGLTGLFGAGADATLVLRNVNVNANRTITTIGSNYAPHTAPNAHIVIENSTLYTSGYYGLGTNASEEFTCYYEIKNSSITADYEDGDCAALLFNVTGGVTAENSTFTAGRQAAIIRGGNAVFTNCVITNTGASTLVESYIDSNWDSGNNLPMAALVVGDRSNSYPYSAEVSLRSCELVSLKAEVPAIYIWGESEEYSATLNYDSATNFQATIKIAGKEEDDSTVIINGNVAAVVTSFDELKSALEKGGDVVLSNEITVTEGATTLEVKSGDTLRIIGAGIININGTAELTIVNNGSIIQTMQSEVGYLFRASGNSKLTLNGDGEYVAGLTVGQAGDNSVITVNGGSFNALVGWSASEDIPETNWIFNLIDNSNATISVTAGTFVNYDPSNSQTENPPANFVAEGYVVNKTTGENGTPIYTVVPEAQQ